MRSVLAFLSLALCISSCRPAEQGIEYVNPRVFNVDFTFELRPDSGTIDREHDLKLWLPVPGEWDSQRAVRIISVDPAPHAEYTDPEFGNRMFFWDFAEEPERPVYVVNLRYRLESFDLRADIDPDRVGAYDESSDLYALYTRSTDHIEISPEIVALAQEAVGDEDNPYRQAKRILDSVVANVRYAWNRPDKRVGTRALLNTVAIDEETGERYYQGECVLQAEFFVALCRAVGIPARAVTGMVGWGPWVKKEDLRLRNKAHTQLSSDGLAAARPFGPLTGHRWAEFYLPNYGWIPVDPTWDRFAWLGNRRLIWSKGTDVLIGPQVPPGDGAGYGDQWIALRDGRIDTFGFGVWNLARVRVANAKLVHHSDPFPADALAGYLAMPETNDLSAAPPAFDGRETLRLIDDITRDRADKAGALAEAIAEKPRLKEDQDEFIIHMFRDVVGDEAFQEVYAAYTESRLESGEPVPTRRFQEIAEAVHGESLEWFFRQWLDNEELPQLRLEGVDIENQGHEWLIRANLRQPGDPVFRLPVKLEIASEKETRVESVWLDTREASFEFTTPDRPQKITIDPAFDLLKIQKMPPVLSDLWSGWPDGLLVVYGTMAEGPANQAAAESFNEGFLGLDDRVVKADQEVSEADLKGRVLVLFGRPETNLLAQRYAEEFPVRFDEGRFSYGGVSYGEPTQGVAQIVENPWDFEGVIIMYAGLSGEATRSVCDKSEWREALGGSFLIDMDASYVIYGRHQILASGNWEAFDGDLVWTAGESAEAAKS
jgi:transglutaminase-like putative cysteine protease